MKNFSKISLADKFWLTDLVGLVYPELCAACERPLVKGEDLICLHCEHSLPQTNYHLEPDNNLEKHFWGRVKIERAMALYFFSKGSAVQHLVHQLKYKGKREIGEKLGEYYGKILKNSGVKYDAVLAVPLHKEKEYKRGYNQSAVFAAGLAKGMDILFYRNALAREKFTETQTKKSRIQRWENVEDVFDVVVPNQLIGKHILLVDDVITTGATIEACVLPIQELHNVKLSIGAIAIAQHF